MLGINNFQCFDKQIILSEIRESFKTYHPISFLKLLESRTIWLKKNTIYIKLERNLNQNFQLMSKIIFLNF